MGDSQRISASAPVIAPQVLLEGLPLHGPDVHFLPEKLQGPVPAFLGLVHCGIRVLDERLRIQTVVGIEAHANACGDVKNAVADGVSLRQRR